MTAVAPQEPGLEPGSEGSLEPNALVNRPVLPEGFGYRAKLKLLGPPLDSDELEHQRLGIPTALAVFSSDCISSSAYATEEILHVLIPVIGVFAFSMVVPVTVAMLVVLTFLILSYRETIKEYPTAGGAYMVTRDNFGYKPALVAGVSLLTDYILTVAVSASAGIAALTSLFSGLRPYHLEMALFVVVFIAYMNLRGVKESGRVFMVPTYLFIAAMAAMIVAGIVRAAGGGLSHVSLSHGAELLGAGAHGSMGVADKIFYGAALFKVLQAFASAGTAVTGVEAISNGVSAFHKPEWRHARRTLVIMGVTLGTCFLGLSFLATKTHPSPYESGSPTVLAQVGKEVFGHAGPGFVVYVFLQASTLLILCLAANTSFADFPRLANFAAGDSYMPRQLMKRGHRLVFSNGIMLLAGCAIALMIVTDANVSRLIPFYAVGVFTSFTMSQAGMTRHHIRKREPGWQRGVFVNGMGALLSLVVDVVFLVTKFTEGAWFILVLIPVLVALLVRMNRQYVEEAVELKSAAPTVATMPILQRHVVLVLVDELDRPTARAIQYARTLMPDEVRAVHWAIDEPRAEMLALEWRQLGLSRVPLQIIECPDRRVTRGAMELAAELTVAGDTELTVLLPRTEYRRVWHRLLHDRTGDHIAEELSELPHVNVTFVPYHLTAGRKRSNLTAADVLEQAAELDHGGARRLTVDATIDTGTPGVYSHEEEELGRDVRRVGRPVDLHLVAAEPAEGIAAVRFRQRVDLTGHVRALQVQPWSGVASLQVTLADAHGEIQVVFLGRRDVPGITVGRRLRVAGTVGRHKGRLALLNPTYQLLA
ncbi:MAG TPA: amino acid permease [Acidimicrobiales bacterium]|nr:amino acid permease [Acidimicrobiales bacterium]